ncbi:transposase [Haloferax elongans ATCC BAA-1513]|uniref:Transposase n=1 Tax=Haloferax elongans ATCC BAA-1513 TaxID=1230453 RepID=M0I2B0_HALEO|nr:DUF4157 domain-containing protein [Haloferax elongans]ELZ89509.1 transposase [Haloferax elongans ATCC BAA-1513]
MGRRSSRQNKSDDDSQTYHSHRRTHDIDSDLRTNQSAYVGPDDGRGVYYQGERDPDSVYASTVPAAPQTETTAQTKRDDAPPGSIANGLLQRKTKDDRPDWDGEDPGVPEPVRDVLSSPGRGLCGPIQSDIEEKMGETFGDVRIHTGSDAAKACDAVNARAFTAGNHIVFNDGEYDPKTPHGKYVLAHEMAHVKQQTGGALSLLPQPDSELVVDPDERLEREADQAAAAVLQGENGDNPRIQRLPGTSAEVHIQRIPEGKVFEALALFEAERGDEDISDHRQQHNNHQFGFLYEVAQDVIEKQDTQEKLDLKQEVANTKSPDQTAEELSKRFDSIADLKSQIEDLKNSVDADLEDVALTDDQRLQLDGQTETNKWDNVSWTVVKSILSATAIPQLLDIANVAGEVSASEAVTSTDTSTQAAGYDINERAKQTIAHARKRKITSFKDIKKIWTQTNGTLEERAQQIEQEIREGTFLEDASRGLSQSTIGGE